MDQSVHWVFAKRRIRVIINVAWLLETHLTCLVDVDRWCLRRSHDCSQPSLVLSTDWLTLSLAKWAKTCLLILESIKEILRLDRLVTANHFLSQKLRRCRHILRCLWRSICLCHGLLQAWLRHLTEETTLERRMLVLIVKVAWDQRCVFLLLLAFVLWLLLFELPQVFIHEWESAYRAIRLLLVRDKRTWCLDVVHLLLLLREEVPDLLLFLHNLHLLKTLLLSNLLDRWHNCLLTLLVLTVTPRFETPFILCLKAALLPSRRCFILLGNMVLQLLCRCQVTLRPMHATLHSVCHVWLWLALMHTRVININLLDYLLVLNPFVLGCLTCLLEDTGSFEIRGGVLITTGLFLQHYFSNKICLIFLTCFV